MPTDDLVAALTQTLLHKLAVHAAAPDRLSSRCGRCTACTNGGCTCCNVFKIGFVTAEQRAHHTRCADACGARRSCTTGINLVDSANFRLTRQF